MLQMETVTMSLQELQFAVSLFAFAVTIWVHDVQYYMTWWGRLLQYLPAYKNLYLRTC